MANDKLFHKRKEREAKNLSRRKTRMSSYGRVLIVCEGTKTEPHYFRGLVNSYKLNRNNITIVGEGASPTSIVRVAEEKHETSRKNGIPFGKVFCVFDKNSHADYGRALAQIANKENFEAIVSVPCFEYWLLLHYRHTTKAFEKRGKGSACDHVVSELKTHIPRYKKGENNTFSRVEENLNVAITNAKSTLAAARKAGTDNPSTNVHILIEHLQTTARSRR